MALALTRAANAAGSTGEGEAYIGMTKRYTRCCVARSWSTVPARMARPFPVMAGMTGAIYRTA